MPYPQRHASLRSVRKEPDQTAARALWEAPLYFPGSSAPASAHPAPRTPQAGQPGLQHWSAPRTPRIAHHRAGPPRPRRLRGALTTRPARTAIQAMNGFQIGMKSALKVQLKALKTRTPLMTGPTATQRLRAWPSSGEPLGGPAPTPLYPVCPAHFPPSPNPLQAGGCCKRLQGAPRFG